jgi:hypothetical protein
MENEILSRVAVEFLQHGERDYTGSSGLYRKLSGFVAADSELLEIASFGTSPTPNLFFGAVHYLLMRSKAETLTKYYPSLHQPINTGDDLFPIFRSFCLSHKEELIQIVSSRTVQTNEVSRCAYLYPAFAVASAIVRHVPLALIDVGSSVGLHLLCDRYAYDYGLGRILGDKNSPVVIESELRGSSQPIVGDMALKVGSRFGIELHPISPYSSDDVSWLDALIWPEHEARRKLFYSAIDVLKQEKSPFTRFEGDAAEVLPTVLSKVPSDEVACVYQTHIWRQLSDPAKTKIIHILESFGRDRAIIFVSALNQLTLNLYAPSGHRHWTLANYEQHGRWLEWLYHPSEHS